MGNSLVELSKHAQTWRIAIGKLAPIMPLIEDDSITEIILTRHSLARVERKGRLETVDGVAFASDEALYEAVEQIAKSLQQKYDRYSSPILDGRLPNGYRIHSVAYPYSVHGTTLNIRKFGAQLFTPDQLIDWGMFNAEMYAFMALAMKLKAVMLLSGGTGSGKTSILKVLAAHTIDPMEHVVSVEGTHELQELATILRDYTALEAANKSIEAETKMSLHAFIATILRMRADRAMIGELRTPEDVDAYLNLLNSGHGGILATIHANSALDTVHRAEYLLLSYKPNLNMESVRNVVRSNIELVIYVERDYATGVRRVIEIAEVTAEGVHVIYRYNRKMQRHERISDASAMLGRAAERGLIPSAKFADLGRV